MMKLIATVALTAMVLPSIATAQDTRGDSNGGRDSREEQSESGGFARGDRETFGRPTAQAGGDVLPEDLINEICEDGDVIIIYGDDGSIEDWDCDFS